MGLLHASLAWVSAASVVALLAVAVATAAGATRSYRGLDGVLIVQAAATALVSLAGLGVVAAEGMPRDPLHVLYGIVATGLPLGVRIAAQGRTVRVVGRWVAVAALVTVGVMLRSFMTGS